MTNTINGRTAFIKLANVRDLFARLEKCPYAIAGRSKPPTDELRVITYRPSDADAIDQAIADASAQQNAIRAITDNPAEEKVMRLRFTRPKTATIEDYRREWRAMTRRAQ